LLRCSPALVLGWLLLLLCAPANPLTPIQFELLLLLQLLRLLCQSAETADASNTAQLS
jgi:hypothetical protein